MCEEFGGRTWGWKRALARTHAYPRSRATRSSTRVRLGVCPGSQGAWAGSRCRKHGVNGGGRGLGGRGQLPLVYREHT